MKLTRLRNLLFMQTMCWNKRNPRLFARKLVIELTALGLKGVKLSGLHDLLQFGHRETARGLSTRCRFAATVRAGGGATASSSERNEMVAQAANSSSHQLTHWVLTANAEKHAKASREMATSRFTFGF